MAAPEGIDKGTYACIIILCTQLYNIRFCSLQRQRGFGRIQEEWSSGSMASSRRPTEGASADGAPNTEKAWTSDDGEWRQVTSSVSWSK